MTTFAVSLTACLASVVVPSFCTILGALASSALRSLGTGFRKFAFLLPKRKLPLAPKFSYRPTVQKSITLLDHIIFTKPFGLVTRIMLRCSLTIESSTPWLSVSKILQRHV